MTIQQQISDLAKSMNLSEVDVQSFAQSMVNLMIKDGITSDNIAEHGTELVQAYAKPVVNKFESFQSAYLTNQAFATDFRLAVFASI